jgi:hypothetical protein
VSVTCIAPNGAEFSNSWWDWRPLAAYCFEICPRLEKSNHYRHWETNDGSVTAAEARALGWALWREIDGGRTLEYLQARRRRIEAMPDEPCKYCDGSGTRHHTPLTISMCETFRGSTQLRIGDPYECNVCTGLGTVRPDDDRYFFTVENVEAFSHFCRVSDGFEVT